MAAAQQGVQPPAASAEIRPTATEELFFTYLNDFVKKGRLRVKPRIPETECRIAGGWVRDKLLGLPSHDLDVTLSSCAGYPFAQAFVNYLRTLPGASDIGIKSIGKVSANPDQSKHLETATTTIMGLECDFVQLRSEVYADGSRIPSEVRIGTPLEDAERRDTTINSLFYNVHTRSVEDWTGKGLSDLANRLIRTPLEPLKTFQDDPLRILRCLRFASRYGHRLDDELTQSLGNEEILEALRGRISRERVGIEVEKMIRGPNPLLSIELIITLNLYPHIFLIPSTTSSTTIHEPPQPPSQALLGAQILSSILDASTASAPAPSTLASHIHPALLKNLNGKKLGNMWLAVALLPFRGATVKDKKKDVGMAELVIRDGLKLGNAEKDAVARLFAAHDKLSPPTWNQYGQDKVRSGLGLVLRESYINDPATDTCWTNAVIFSIIIDILPHLEVGKVELNDKVANILHQYYDFTAKIEELGLGSAIEQKPLLDGNRVNSLLSLKPSQLTKYLILEVVRWQLDHPQGTVQDCEAWMLEAQSKDALPTLQSLGIVAPPKKRGRD